MIRAAEYARYSTDNQTSNSIEYQFCKIREYCLNNDIEIVASFYDEAKSGTNLSREGFQQMLTAAHRKEFDAVVIYDVTRGSRDVADWFSFRKEMRALRISVISVENNLGDPLNPNDFLIELMNVGLGQHQVLTSRQKSIDGVAVKAREAVFLGGIAPLGYDIVEGKYVVNEMEADIVRKIFDLYASGKSYNQILDTLKNKKGKRGRPFGKNSIQSILSNDRYIGTYTWNKRICKQLRKWAGGVPNPKVIRLEGAIPAIIDDNTWCSCQRRLNTPASNARNTAKREYLLSGLIKCSSCGSSYVGHASTNQRGYENIYYVCSNRKRTRTCKSPNIPAKIIEPFVLENLKEFLSKLDIEFVVDYIYNTYKAMVPNLDKYQSELLDIQTKIKNGMDAILSGIDISELKETLLQLKDRKKELENIISSSNSRLILDKSRLTMFVKKQFSNWEYKNDTELVKSYITGIVIMPNGDIEVSVGVARTDNSEGGI
ncbi:recombinase family protein [Lachnoclostridium phytofermentans]|uniref:recombinase family protein n=1 Tax=Lachnoclostridium phytofermentans TaxID=66219 RepID=UPI000495C2B3|nr:recombinase family protein [Lachnoclostridium phytofermentans]